jgi:hypothetical protein
MGSIEKRTSRSTSHGVRLHDDAYVDHRLDTSRGFSAAGVGRARCFPRARAVGAGAAGADKLRSPSSTTRLRPPETPLERGDAYCTTRKRYFATREGCTSCRSGHAVTQPRKPCPLRNRGRRERWDIERCWRVLSGGGLAYGGRICRLFLPGGRDPPQESKAVVIIARTPSRRTCAAATSEIAIAGRQRSICTKACAAIMTRAVRPV